MKMNILILSLGAAVVASGVAMCQVVIESLDRTGALTWTNSISNATYRVEWASSPTGAWQNFDSLTNLLSIHAMTNVVTSQVPMLYRVVWTDAPPVDPIGRWQYWAYDTNGGTLCSTGLITLWWTNLFGIPDKVMWGKYEFHAPAGLPTQAHPSGQGTIVCYGYPGGSRLRLNTIDAVDNNLYIDGSLSWDTFRGEWEWDGFAFILGSGVFQAQRIPGGG